MRDAVGYELHIFSDAVAGYLLAHLHHLGFFNRTDLNPVLFQDTFSKQEVALVFPIPQGLDLSTDVETLFAAVEGCLSDLDLSVNEQGFLLLVRRLWPNGMASEYALHRLARNLVSWIFAEVMIISVIVKYSLIVVHRMQASHPFCVITWHKVDNCLVSALVLNRNHGHPLIAAGQLLQVLRTMVVTTLRQDVPYYTNTWHVGCWLSMIRTSASMQKCSTTFARISLKTPRLMIDYYWDPGKSVQKR
jgi:hypothetical protein